MCIIEHPTRPPEAASHTPKVVSAQVRRNEGKVFWSVQSVPRRIALCAVHQQKLIENLDGFAERILDVFQGGGSVFGCVFKSRAAHGRR